MIDYGMIVLALKLCLSVLSWLVVFECILSWLPIGDNVLVRLISSLTEPLIELVRKIFLRSSIFDSMSIDIAPLILIILLDVISSLL